jgi:hypothetical protein
LGWTPFFLQKPLLAADRCGTVGKAAAQKLVSAIELRLAELSSDHISLQDLRNELVQYATDINVLVPCANATVTFSGSSNVTTRCRYGFNFYFGIAAVKPRAEYDIQTELYIDGLHFRRWPGGSKRSKRSERRYS